MYETRPRPTINVPEGALSWEWEELNVPGVPSKQATDLRLNGEPIPAGVAQMPWRQVIEYRERDR
jgi:hypothetical protein